MMLLAIVALFSLSLTMPDANLNLFLYDKVISNEKRFGQFFNGKRIWITGASSGIGAELAVRLHSYGAQVIITGRREKELEHVRDECIRRSSTISSPIVSEGLNQSIVDFNKNVQLLPFDVTSGDEAVSNTVKAAIELYDGIDMLILNAGRGQLCPALDVKDFSTARDLMEVNYFGPVRLATEVIRQSKWGEYDEDGEKKNGHIVVTSSVAGKMALPMGTSYAASKHAVVGYFTSLRSEYSEWLRVDLPSPGPIATEFHDKVETLSSSSSTSESSSEETDDSETKIPLKRCAQLMLSSMMGPSFIMQETWISRQPTLGFFYLHQYLPLIANGILSTVGPLRIKAWRNGLPLYKVSSWIKAAKMDKKKSK